MDFVSKLVKVNESDDISTTLFETKMFRFIDLGYCRIGNFIYNDENFKNITRKCSKL